MAEGLFNRKKIGSLLIEFEKDGIRRVSRAAWVSGIDIVKDMLLIDISPVVKLQNGSMESCCSGGIITARLDEIMYFEYFNEDHFAGENLKHFSVYDPWKLTRPQLQGTEDGLRAYISDFKAAITIVRG